eukprot:scaffold268_cov210-Ochromonas_danica.AAC.20
MIGRGRGLTLPSWMTNGSAGGSVVTEGAKAPSLGPSLSLPLSSAGSSQQLPCLLQTPVLTHPMYLACPRSASAPSVVGVAPPVCPPSLPPPKLVGFPSLPVSAPFARPPLDPTLLYMNHAALGNAGLKPSVLLPAPFKAAADPVKPDQSSQLSSQTQPQVLDPNNDASLWAEYMTAEGRKYWYNAVTLVSTLDKPFCLKTPEERAIPPCPWKEYVTDGKVYYSDGKESRWTMPEEYRLWKEKVDAIEKKKSGNMSSFTGLAPSRGGKRGIEAVEESTVKTNTPIYATAEEAMEAFHALLLAKGISVTAKMKEVQDLCSKDPRWEALKTQGEKRQALAEYQTKKLKLEKEQQKAKARKHRDAFLLMLAENTVIDVRTDWKTALEVLKDDYRFKNIEDPREREDLFKDFIQELQKKEREDANRARSKAIEILERELRQLQEQGLIDRKSTWIDRRDGLLALLSQSEFKVLNEVDVRRAFQSLVDTLIEDHRKGEKIRKERFQEGVRHHGQELRKLFDTLIKDGVITLQCRFRDDVLQSALKQSEPFQGLLNTFKDYYGDVDKMPHEAEARDVFDAFLNDLHDVLHEDKRLVKKLLQEHNMRIGVESRLEDFHLWLRKISSQEGLDVGLEPANREEGEEDDDSRRQSRDRHSHHKSSLVLSLRTVLSDRPFAVQYIFQEFHDRAVAEREEEAREQRKAEERYIRKADGQGAEDSPQRKRLKQE